MCVAKKSLIFVLVTRGSSTVAAAVAGIAAGRAAGSATCACAKSSSGFRTNSQLFTFPIGSGIAGMPGSCRHSWSTINLN